MEEEEGKQTNKKPDSNIESCQINYYSLGSQSTEAKTKRTHRAVLAN